MIAGGQFDVDRERTVAGANSLRRHLNFFGVGRDVGVRGGWLIRYGRLQSLDWECLGFFRLLSAGAAELRASFTFVYCRDDNTGTCRIKTLVWRAPVEVVADVNAP